MNFDPRTAQSFEFLEASFQGSEARFSFRFDQGPEFVERIIFPLAAEALDQPGFARALNLALHVIGISYYKAGVPKTMRSRPGIDPAMAHLLQQLYTFGLGEFAHQNGIDIRARVRFQASAEAHSASSIELPRRTLVPIGGGKDSLVTIEALKAAGEPVCATWVGDSELIAATAERSTAPTLRIKRVLDPQLFALNRAGAYNGHIPVTAINSVILLMAALLYGYDRIAFSNEASASSPNLVQEGMPVNHQWSKGIEFERLFAGYVKARVSTKLSYFSLLRPHSELKIASKFARLDQYHGVFSSCNRNFKILGARPEQRWCGQCPKCLFVFAAMAPFMAKPALTQIFGRNLLDEAALQDGYEALLEWQGKHKPFECVGEARETRAALHELSRRPDWQEDVIVKHFAREIAPQLEPSSLALSGLMHTTPHDLIPMELVNAVDQLQPT